MSKTKTTAAGIASLGRGNDKMLVHMTPREVHGLQSLAMAHGGSLTINPHTGLPEAGFLEDILPVLAGAAAIYFTAGAAAPEVVAASTAGEAAALTAAQAGLAAPEIAGGIASLGEGATAATNALEAANAAQQASSATEAFNLAQQTATPTGVIADASWGVNPQSPYNIGGADVSGGMYESVMNNIPRAELSPYTLAQQGTPTGISPYTTQTAANAPASQFALAGPPAPPSPYALAQPATTTQMGGIYPSTAPAAEPGLIDKGIAWAGKNPVSAAMLGYTGLSALTQKTPQAPGRRSFPYKQYTYDPTSQQYTLQAAQGGMVPGYASGGISDLNTYAAGGKLLRGDGDGMSDSIPAVIKGPRPQRAALADGEFVVPADVVSHLGNGSTEAGAKHLYSMMDRIRAARTGRKKQAPAVKANKYLPA